MLNETDYIRYKNYYLNDQFFLMISAHILESSTLELEYINEFRMYNVTVKHIKPAIKLPRTLLTHGPQWATRNIQQLQTKLEVVLWPQEQNPTLYDTSRFRRSFQIKRRRFLTAASGKQ
ncbi:unnamed protein product [Ilex paraguariensis]|uniref:Uncharacterized protein n=1 Tax=Ilex paraguariensis TaxID=185542 RepID=A0ABC8R7L5_9AQUA